MARISGSPSAPRSSDSVTTAVEESKTARPDSSSENISSEESSDTIYVTEIRSKSNTFDPSLLPTGKRSLSVISLQGFWTGFAFAASLILAPQLAYHGNSLWRFFAFLGSLSAFHFLEFWTTARFNTQSAFASSFLIYSNGSAYNVAHGCAALEIMSSHFLFPKWQAYLSSPVMSAVGLVFVVLGQLVRSLAMATAGTNFNHIPQQSKTQGHELVTSGIYSLSRHPSYFAFFWWALGTQILVGNKICFVAYAGVLWKFFNDRIRGEEQKLIEFYGKKYEAYRARTPTGIPFI